MSRLAVLVCVLAAALAGCGGDGSDGSGGDAGGGQETAGDGGRRGDRGGRQPGGRRSDALRGDDAPRGNFFRLEEVATGLEQPLGLVPAPGSGQLHVVEQGGRIVALDEQGRPARTVIDLSERVRSGGEQGLLGLAFHPDYPGNPRIYVHYTNESGNTRVDEYRTRGGVADEGSRRELLALEQPYPNHNGGQLSFGPDGLLYLGLGDGGGANDQDDRAQSLDTQLGKLLRRNPDSPPGEWTIVAYGLRNPWRFSWDRETGSLWIADVGQDEREEIDVVTKLPTEAPLNFGWPAWEGTYDLDGRDTEGPGRVVFPVAEYSHDEGCSLTGGYVYRGRAVPGLRGRYVYGDFCSGRVWTLRAGRESASDARREAEDVEQLSAFGEDLDGELYAVSLDGRVLRLVAP